MKIFRVYQKSSLCSTSSLIRKVEPVLNEMEREGWNVVSVSIGYSGLCLPTAFITVSREVDEITD